MLRARQTAEYVRVLFPQVAAEVVYGLREFEPFDFSTKPPMRPEERQPLLMDYWAGCDLERVGDGARAESFSQFRRRVDEALAGFRSADIDTLAVCHGGVIKLAEMLFEPESWNLEAGALMRAWVARATIHNCGLRRFDLQIDPASRRDGNSGPRELNS